MLCNIYLHSVLDLWIDQWRGKQAKGDVIVVRYADDFVIGFQSETEARSCLNELRERLAAFNLELHPEKTRLIEFGRFTRAVLRCWWKSLRRRSHKSNCDWHRFYTRLARRWMPALRVMHPYPEHRLCVTT